MRFEVEARIVRPTGFALEASLDCEARALAIVGPSGSGKSTLLDAIAGVERGARVRIDGRDVSSLALHQREVGYVTQDPLLFPHLDVRRNLAYGPRAEGIEETARSLGIGHLLDRMPRHLSGGEKRRVGLARALVSRPRVLLLDEPFGGLDETRRRDSMSFLSWVHRTFDVPMVLVSHLADEVIGLTDHAVRLEAGRVAARGSSASVLRAAETRVDNYFEGEALGDERVRLADGTKLVAVLPPRTTGPVRLACYAFDVLLAGSPPTGISARNVVPARVSALVPAGESVLVELGSLPLRAMLTQGAVRAMELAPGAPVVAIVKATSIAYLGPA